VQLRIAAVDPSDANKVYFRGKDANSGAESLVISSDGGATTRIAQAMPAGYVMTAFLRQADGTILVTGLQLNPGGSLDCNGHEPYQGASAMPVAYRSSDGGQTFVAWTGAPRLRGLAERGGTVYGVADNFADGFAVGQSTDGGKTWKGLLKYVDIQGPQTCEEVASTCAASWAALQVTFGIPAGGTKPPAKHGCSFSAASGHARELLFLLPLLVGLAIARRRRATR
jgi:MYXO-CTERM domain-containing protein